MEDEDEIAKEGEELDEDDDEEDVKTVTSEDAVEASHRVKNKRKNFQPRSIVSEEVSRVEKNRRKGATTPQKCLKPEVMDLSLRESNDETDSDASESSKTKINLKNFRKVKAEKCHGQSESLLSLLNSDTRLNNPFGIDLSKFGRSGSQVPGYSEVLAGVRKGESGETPSLPLPGKPILLFFFSAFA